jgi:hypothetical protein
MVLYRHCLIEVLAFGQHGVLKGLLDTHLQPGQVFREVVLCTTIFQNIVFDA